MWCKIDLTGETHLAMEYLFVSTAALQVPTQMPDHFELLICDFIWHTYPEFQFPELIKCLPARLTNPLPDALIYAGWAKMRFEGVQGGSIKVHPYKPRFGPGDRDLMKQNGKTVELLREWPIIESKKEGVDYQLACKLEQPFGAMSLELFASGSVTLSVDPSQFYLDGEEFAWYDETRQRLLRSID